MTYRSLPALLFLLTTQAFAQEPDDALRYSRFFPSGTARSIAIGGAMTALGGDISAANINPAGLAQFKTNELVLSPGFILQGSRADYLGSDRKSSRSLGDYGTTGVVFSNPPQRRGGPWKNFTYAITAARTANFNNRISYAGTNNKSSYSEKYLEELIDNNATNPNAAATDFPFGSSLAINTYLVEPTLNTAGQATGYYTMATPKTGVKQEQVIDTKGGITTISFAGAGNLSDRLFIGASLNFESLTYTRDQTYKESDISGNTKNNFNYFTVNDYLETTGGGLNLKLGMIFKASELMRLGLSVHTPTWFNLSDRYNTTITTDLEGYAGPGTLTQQTADLLGQFGEYNYQFINPWRVMGGVAIVLGSVEDVTQQKGFLTADVEFVHYGKGNFSDPKNPSSSYFRELNQIIGQEFSNIINARVGGELKFNTLMVRAGMGYFGNPYQDPERSGTRLNLSGGVGWRNRGKFVDFTYLQQFTNDGFYPYRLNGNFFAPVNLKGSIGQLLLTFGFKF